MNKTKELKKETTFNINIIRKEVAKFQKILVWYEHRGGLLPYDWQSNFRVDWLEFLDYVKVDYQGNIRKKDKRGSWR